MKTTWADQLKKSLDEGPEEYRNYEREIVEALPVDEDDESAGLFRAGWNALAHAYVHKAWLHLERLHRRVASPIEQAMLIGLCVAAHEMTENIRYKFRGENFGDHDDLPDLLTIEPQAVLGEYRVDFLVTYSGGFPDDANKQKLKDGTEIPGVKEVTTHMIVECDGHDFHDRSKEQASRDRQRDRELKKLGYEVFRYTGADIWKDVMTCAREVIGTLNNKAWFGK